MTIILPGKVKLILDTLMAAGYEAYAVGGCVRDSLLSRIPNDWDITTSAKPMEVKALFKRTVDTGIKHGTVTVLMGNEGFEVTTYRIDGEYEDMRHPKEVTFTSLLSEDLRRRDFTINAMAYNDKDGLVDLFEGERDLKRGLVRAVGKPADRFGEDALRILRAVRFAAQLGYEIEEETAAAAGELAFNLKNISAERINAELVKLLTSDHPEYLIKAYELGITEVFLPEFDRCMKTEQHNPHHCYTVGLHSIKAVCNIKRESPEDPYFRLLRIAMLLHDVAKPACLTTDEKGIDHFRGHPEVGSRMAAEILRRLKFDNRTIGFACEVVRYHDTRPELSERHIRRAINKMGLEIFQVLERVQLADISAQSEYEREDKFKRLQDMMDIGRKILDRGDPLFLKDLALNGNDLIKEELAQGAEIGWMLDKLLDLVLNDPLMNDRELLLERARILRRSKR